MNLGIRISFLAAGLVGLGLAADAQTAKFTPVTDAMLQNPNPADWINWRRTLDGWGFSPLTQINTRNVQQLQMAWSWTLGPGLSEPTPIVYNGVMYIASPGGTLQALDAATGDFIWEYRKEFPNGLGGSGTMRSIAIYDDKVYLCTRDAHIVALNAQTGKVVWDQAVADRTLGYSFTSGPIVVKGKIIAGMTGCARYKSDVCFITARDAQTGHEVWRTATIARPGEPGGDTWGDLPLQFRAGGDAWIPGSYDAAANLIYWSTAQAKPWAQFQRGDPGASELYTNSTLALNPDTGKIAWYHQFIQGDTHDMDEVFESIIVDHDGRKSLFKMGKLGILWELDKTTGEFVRADDLGYQTLFNLNKNNGKLTYRPDMVPKPGVEVSFCPSVFGFKNWRAMAYSPDTQAFYIPIHMSCNDATFSEMERKDGGGGNGPMNRAAHYHPARPNHNLGEFLAMDMKTGRVLWRHETATPMNSAALATAGGLAIAGDWDRNLYVHDATSGKLLFQARLSTAVQGFPITYAVRGKQYIAVPVGSGPGPQIFEIPTFLLPGKPLPPAGNAIFVFALPDPPANSGRGSSK